MKRTFLLLFSLFSLVSLQAENRVSLTLIPPGKITNKVDLDIRGGIVNESASQQTYQVALYWNKENKDALLYETVVTIPAGKAETVKVVIPTKDRVGKNKVIFKVANEGKAYRKTKDIEVIESDIRSIQQISGAWTGIYHWSEIEGKHWNQDIKKMTDATVWCEAGFDNFRGGGFSSSFTTRAEMPATMIRLNLVKGLGPVL